MRCINQKFLLFQLATSLMLFAGCATVAIHPTTWKLPTFTGGSDPAGTPDWWKKHKRKAEFVPGEGYRVAGFEGFYDEEGRSINTLVAKIIKQEEAKDKGLLRDSTVIQKAADIKSQLGLGPDEQLAQQAFAAGEDLFRREQYKEAAKQFKRTIARWPDSRLEQDSMFLLGESQFYADRYPGAMESYQKLLKKYPNSPHLDKSVRRQFEIARYWEQHHQVHPHWAMTPNLLDKTRPLFDTLGHSLKANENIRLNDPTGPLADDAIMATANSYFVRGRYNDADYQYELVRQEYPRSDHQYEAHLLGLQCKLQKYQGPDYDGTPLIEAKKIAKQIKTQFAGELSTQERERLAEVEGQLNLNLAERDFRRAEYWENIEHYGSAKFYYAQLGRKHPNTPLATKAKERFEALVGKPDHPDSVMQPLLDRLPESAERKAIAQVPFLNQASDVRLADQPQLDDAGTVRR